MLTRKQRRAAARKDGTNWNESEHNTCRPLPEKKFMWYSNAQWPEGTYPFSNDMTDDRHYSFDEAQAVCDHLYSRPTEPIKTWVTRDRPACEGGKEYKPA